jgi:hypothetical protein
VKRRRDSGFGEIGHGGIVDFDKLLHFLYDYRCGDWKYGVVINP